MHENEIELSKIFTKDTFNSTLSCVRAKQKGRPELVAHELALFDLCQIYNRAAKEKF